MLKLLEKLIFEKLAPIVYATLTPDQHGVRSTRSTITNLIEYLHELFSCLNLSNYNYLNTFYLDFQKAFDKVSHGILLKKLSTFGIGGNCLSLIHSYLSNWKQTMRLNDTFSGELEIFSGVPQGSILGPLFFLVFIIDLPSCVMSSTFGFADDYKNVGDNPLTLSIDVRRLLRMCDDWVLCEPLDFIPKSFVIIISIKCDFRPWVSFYIITFFKKRHAEKDIVRAPTF